MGAEVQPHQTTHGGAGPKPLLGEDLLKLVLRLTGSKQISMRLANWAFPVSRYVAGPPQGYKGCRWPNAGQILL